MNNRGRWPPLAAQPHAPFIYLQTDDLNLEPVGTD
jgi:hypothetical protein